MLRQQNSSYFMTENNVAPASCCTAADSQKLWGVEVLTKLSWSLAACIYLLWDWKMVIITCWYTQNAANPVCVPVKSVSYQLQQHPKMTSGLASAVCLIPCECSVTPASIRSSIIPELCIFLIHTCMHTSVCLPAGCLCLCVFICILSRSSWRWCWIFVARHRVMLMHVADKSTNQQWNVSDSWPVWGCHGSCAVHFGRTRPELDQGWRKADWQQNQWPVWMIRH